MNGVANLFGRLRRDRRGSVAVMMAAGLVLFIGFGAAVVDIGYLFHVKRVLQTSADMAALAGAQDINCCSGSPGRAVTTAVSYSGVTGHRNATPDLDVTMASGYPALRCFSSTGMPCAGSDSANGIVVKQQTEVPLFFAKIFGNSSIQVSVTSVAGKGGASKPADVIVILDTTASMNTVDPSCSIVGATRLDCAFAGFRTLLAGFSPTQNRVGLMLFPGLTSTGAAALEHDCSGTTPASSTIAAYNASSNPPVTTPPVYLVVPLSNDYQDAGGNLNPNSDLVKAARGGGSGCSAGVTAYGGVGTYYADAIAAADGYLAANARAGVQKIIVLLSDGDANNASAAPGGQNACRRGITMASQAKAAGNTMITIAYGAPTAATPASCPTDTGTPISACAALQQIASGPSHFYSDNVGGMNSCTSAAHSATDLSAIFQDIVANLTGARLLPENTM